MTMADWPEWVQRIYWHIHGPIGHAQPRAEGYTSMTTSSIIQFFMTEAVLIIAMLFVVWGVKRTDRDADPKKYITWLAYVLFGGLALIVLIRFIGVG